jgi:hypothetical protein
MAGAWVGAGMSLTRKEREELALKRLESHPIVYCRDCANYAQDVNTPIPGYGRCSLIPMESTMRTRNPDLPRRCPEQRCKQ